LYFIIKFLFYLPAQESNNKQNKILNKNKKKARNNKDQILKAKDGLKKRNHSLPHSHI
jgi:hypothetical protein